MLIAPPSTIIEFSVRKRESNRGSGWAVMEALAEIRSTLLTVGS
jgi:hypothetical protein